MKISLKTKALFALLTTVILWSLSVVITRSVVKDIHPMTMNFSRLLVATIAFIPFFLLQKPWKSRAFPKLVAASLFSTINFNFFMLGISYTSASASQLIYVVMPILIILIGIFFLKEKYSLERIVGVLIGFLGIIFIVYLSFIEKGTTISGSLLGNILIIIAMAGWLSYILLSKRLLKIFTPVEMASTAIIVAFVISVPLFLGENFLMYESHLSIKSIEAIIFVGFFGTFLPYILYQYGLKQVSPLTASFTTYIQPITTTLLEIILLGEKLTAGFLLGGILVCLGVFWATTLEIYKRRR